MSDDRTKVMDDIIRNVGESKTFSFESTYKRMMEQAETLTPALERMAALRDEARSAYEAYNSALMGDYNFPSPGVQWELLSAKAKHAWATVVQHIKEGK